MPMNLEQIARLAGVSRSTVSRVLNNHPYVKEEVRQRVMAVIDREGFQTNAAARMLVRQRTEVIGVIAPEGLGAVFSSSYFPVLLSGISSTISQAQYAMSLWAGTTQEENEQMYRRILSYRLMDGALLITAVEGDTLPQRLYERHMPMVLIGKSSFPNVSTVDVDNVNAAREATNYLINKGCRRIAHITGRLDIISAHDRLLGYQMALKEHQLTYFPTLVVEGDFSELSGFAAGHKLAAQGIDGIFAANDTSAIGAMRALAEHGLSVPRDVGIVGFDDMPLSTQITPALTTVRQPIYDLGVVATHLLTELIDSASEEPQHIVLPTQLMIRDT